MSSTTSSGPTRSGSAAHHSPVREQPEFGELELHRGQPLATWMQIEAASCCAALPAAGNAKSPVAQRAGRTRSRGTKPHAQGRAALDFSSKLSILVCFCLVRPMSSRPLSMQCLRCGSMSNLTTPPSGPRISCFSRSIDSVALAPRSASSNSFSRSSGTDLDRQHAVLEAVVVEDVAELRRDHAADAVVHQRPGRVLARGAAAEVVVGDDDLGLAVGRLVEHEIRVLAAVVLVAQLREQALGEPGALERLQVLLGDDHVGVDIDDPQRRGDAFQLVEFFHGRVSLSL